MNENCFYLIDVAATNTHGFSSSSDRLLFRLKAARQHRFLSSKLIIAFFFVDYKNALIFHRCNLSVSQIFNKSNFKRSKWRMSYKYSMFVIKGKWSCFHPGFMLNMGILESLYAYLSSVWRCFTMREIARY